MKILSVGAELFHPGVRTDRHDEAKSRFPHFVNAFLKGKTVRYFTFNL